MFVTRRRRKRYGVYPCEHKKISDSNSDNISGTLVVKRCTQINNTSNTDCEKSSATKTTADAVKAEVVNLPLLHKSKTILTKFNKSHGLPPDVGTIRKPYDGRKTLKPITIYALQARFTDHKPKDFQSTISSIQFSLPLSEMNASAESQGGGATAPSGTEQQSILPFPPVQDDEIDKHRHLNEEAEKASQKAATHDVHPDYLKRLKLERKALAERNREMKLAKKKLLLQQQKRNAKVKTKEIKDEFFFPEPQPLPPPKPKEVEPKPVKTVLGFRYSQAIEEYYRGKLKHIRSFVTLLNDIDDEAKDEVVNGWFVRTLGAQVLNLQARTLPSCNPVEIRLRQQQARIRNRDSTRSLLSIHRSFSRESSASRVLLRSHDSLTKFRSIEEDNNSSRRSTESGESVSANNTVFTDRTGVFGGETHSPPGVTSPRKVSEIHVHSPDFYPTLSRSPTKTITLRLPPIVSEES